MADERPAGGPLYFVTGNRAKLAQLCWVAQYLGARGEILSAREHLGPGARYSEVGETEAEIARLGALDVAARLGVPVLTEDTGLHVAALGGEPGARAGRYLRVHGRAGLLRRLTGCHNREAEIVSAAAYATPDGGYLVYEKRVAGQIAPAERWTPGLPDWIAPTPDNPSGGGYNALFVPAGGIRTLAEIPPAEAMQWGYREPNFSQLLRDLGWVAQSEIVWR